MATLAVADQITISDSVSFVLTQGQRLTRLLTEVIIEKDSTPRLSRAKIEVILKGSPRVLMTHYYVEIIEPFILPPKTNKAIIFINT